MKKKLLVFLLTAVTAISVTACGSASKNSLTADSSAAYDMYDAPASGAYYEEEAYDEGYYDDSSYENTESTNVETSENASTSNRKLIRDVSLNLETKEYDQLLSDIDARVKELGGYIEHLDVYNGSTYSNSRNSRNASLTARIPAKKLDEFLSKVGDVSNITSKTESVRDVTLTYVDMESHKKMLIQERDNLMRYLEQATSIEEIITIEDRLSDVRYQIDSMESQLRTYDNLVDYSTVEIYINEVVTYTPVPDKEETAWERITNGFQKSLEDVIDNFKEFCIEFIIAIPYLIAFAINIAIIVIILKLILNCSKTYRNWKAARKEKKAALKAEKKALKEAKKNGTAISTSESTESTSTDN